MLEWHVDVRGMSYGQYTVDIVAGFRTKHEPTSSIHNIKDILLIIIVIIIIITNIMSCIPATPVPAWRTLSEPYSAPLHIQVICNVDPPPDSTGRFKNVHFTSERPRLDLWKWTSLKRFLDLFWTFRKRFKNVQKRSRKRTLRTF